MHELSLNVKFKNPRKGVKINQSGVYIKEKTSMITVNVVHELSLNVKFKNPRKGVKIN